MNWRYLCCLALFFEEICFCSVEKQLKFEELDRKYVLHVPQGLENKKDNPLVVFCHGAGGNADLASKNYGWQEQADKESFIVVFPESTPVDMNHPAQFSLNPNIWNDGSGRGNKTENDVGFVKKLIETITSEYSIDPKKIYASGFSNGAAFTFRLGVELADTLAAIAPVMGQFWIKDAKVKNPPSLFYIVGANDPLNPINGGLGQNPWQKKPVMQKPMIDSLNEWLKLLGIDPSKKETKQFDGVINSSYGPNSDGKKAVYVILDGQGHQWPKSTTHVPEKFAGKDVSNYNATGHIWDFFKAISTDERSR